ncbi:MAG TPA: hypothetical protein VEY08_09690, partial [Chloroflexia bacterium]|nr:hypothetical protein [Chloroflexia bacterium]
MKKVRLLLVLVLLVGTCEATFSRGAASRLGLTSWPGVWLAESAFFDVWARADGPVAMQAAGRSWLWGPVPFAVANEAYAESPTGKRLVEYLDKGRMEANDPGGDRTSNWFVTSGLLVSELVSGRVQTGDTSFETRTPAQVSVAGDATSPNAPPYAAFASLTAPVPRATGSLAQQAVSKDGAVRPLDEPIPVAGRSASTPGTYDEVSGHNVPAVFTEWMGQTGAVLQGGRLAQGRLMDPLFVLGRPITEAYWVDVLVAGAPARVMLQLFERRTLTYNPANPPQWQVEMANVGRAYYHWRYGSTAPEPAISAEVLPDGVQLRGWNWPPSVEVSARIELGGAETPLVGPLTLQSDASGRFGTLVSMNTEVEGALLAGANLRIVASVGDRQTALPLAVELPSGSPAVEGMLTGVVPTQAGHLLVVRDHAGREWRVDSSVEAVLSYSEGEKTQDANLASGDHVRVEGSILGGKISARSLRLMSVSRTGARLGYNFEGGGAVVRASGTHWPASRDIAFFVRPFAGEGGVQLGTARADSRGNVAASFLVPGILPADQPLWLFAQVVEQNGLVAQVAVLYGPAWEANVSPGLILTADSGEQMGGAGSYCYGGQCVELLGVPVPGDTLMVREGDVLGLRSQLGSNPDLGITPQRFTAQLYAQPPEPANEGASIGGTFYFSPKSLPVFSTGEVTGRPFSVSLPSDLPPGKYLLIA